MHIPTRTLAIIAAALTAATITLGVLAYPMFNRGGDADYAPSSSALGARSAIWCDDAPTGGGILVGGSNAWAPQSCHTLAQDRCPNEACLTHNGTLRADVHAQALQLRSATPVHCSEITWDAWAYDQWPDENREPNANDTHVINRATIATTSAAYAIPNGTIVVLLKPHDAPGARYYVTPDAHSEEHAVGCIRG